MEKYVTIFFVVWLLMAIPSVVFAVRGIRKAKQTFAGVTDQAIRYRERGASGYSKKSILTRIGGANRVLDVILTDKEFCIKGINAIFSMVGSYYDLAHRVQRDKIVSARRVKNHVEVTFVSARGRQSEVVLMLKDNEAFMDAVNGSIVLMKGRER